MTNKYILIIGAAIIVFAGLFSIIFHLRAPIQPLFQAPKMACTSQAKICPDGSSVGRTGPNCQFAECPVVSSYTWGFVGTEASGTPMTAVSLQVLGGKKYFAGDYEGSCSPIASSSWPLLPGEKSGVICWFAGGGTELGIFQENNHMVVKRGTLDEGDAETAGRRGGFRLLFDLGK
jgi:hypothetical protein